MISIPENIVGPISNSVLKTYLTEYKRPNDKIQYLRHKGLLIGLKKGMYILKSTIDSGNYSTLHTANLLYGPSYISGFTALSYWGYIPEKFTLIESSTIKRSAHFETSISNYKFIQSPRNIFPIGLKYQSIGSNLNFLIATPTKALCDIIWQCNSLKINTANDIALYLEEDLRFDLDRIYELDKSIIEKCAKIGKKKYILQLLLDFVNKYNHA